jgi:hypothetical protein
MGGKNSALKHRSGLCKTDRFLFRGSMKFLAELQNRRPGMGRGRAERSKEAAEEPAKESGAAESGASSN